MRSVAVRLFRADGFKEGKTRRPSPATIGYVIVLATFMGSAVNADLSDGLIAHYSFSGNANDASGNSLPGAALLGVLGLSVAGWRLRRSQI